MPISRSETLAQRALKASAVALVVAIGCLVLFLPPLVNTTVTTPLRAALTGLALAAALLLHWIFLGLGARRMQRSAAGWVGMAVLLCPIGGVAAMVLLSFFADENHAAPPLQHG